MALKESTKALYKLALKKLNITDEKELDNSDEIIRRINNMSSTSYKILALKAIYHITTEEQYKPYFKLLQQLQNKKKIDNDNDNDDKLPMTLEELLNIEVIEKDPLRRLVNAFFIWINTHYPLRLDYYNLKINPIKEEKNYLTYHNGILTLYLNDFKNVKTMGSQVITYDSQDIRNYIKSLETYFGHLPEYLLYRWSRKGLLPFKSRIAFGRHLSDIIYKYTRKKVTINTIRKIHESNLIQSESYNKLTNSQKNEKHRALLHSTSTANSVYNKSFK